MFEPSRIFNAASWTGDGDPPRLPIPSWIAPRKVESSRPMSGWDRRNKTSQRPTGEPSRMPSRFPSRRPIDPSIEELPPPSSRRGGGGSGGPPSDAPDLPSIQARDYEDEIARLHETVQKNVEAMASMRRELLEASQRELARLALVIAEKVVGRELASDPAVVMRWAQEGIDYLIDEDDIELAIAPDIAELLHVGAWTDADGVPIKPVVDQTLAIGACELRGSFSRIDAGAQARLAAVAESMGLEQTENDE